MNYINLPKTCILKKNTLVPKNCDNLCVYSIIINRCYYSSYLYASEQLEDKHDFKPLSKWEYGDKKFIPEHSQVIDKFRYLKIFEVNNYMRDLMDLRKKADYEPFSPLLDDELDKAIEHMENIFDILKF